MRNHDNRSSADQEREDKLKLELLKRAVQEGQDQIDRGEFVLVEPSEIGSFVNKLAMKAITRNGSRHSRGKPDLD